MRSLWYRDLTRRRVLQLGAAGAAMLASPLPLRRTAWAAGGAPHFLVVFQADGGWDPTQVFDVHDPADATDGVDVDVPGQPASQITTVGGITYVSNPVTRPAVDTFFTNWASRTAVVNGVLTRSTSHSQSQQLVLTGYLDPTRPDIAVMAAHHGGADLPLPHLLVNGTSFAGPFAALSGRLGGQMGAAIAYNELEDDRHAVSEVGEAYIRDALAAERAVDAARPVSAISARFAEFADGNTRGDLLAELAAAVDIDSNDGTQLATALAQAFRSGLTTSVTASPFGGFDTHDDNTRQSQRFQNVFSFVDEFLTRLAAEPGVIAPNLLDETTIVVCSEFGRTPRLNVDGGKDHHPWDSYLLVGKRVRPGVTVGMTDGNQEGVKVDFGTGLPSDTGQVVDVVNVVAGLVTLIGGNASTYLSGVPPFSAFVGA
jgi:uncharacterized protein (DUF1501 family)